MAPSNNRFLGKYRGRVADNADPLRIGRITASVPDVLGDETSTWAMPCFPFTGPQAGQYVVPEVGAGVWVEFEQGDPSYPIWSGCWFGHESELPEDALKDSPPYEPVVIQTPRKHKIVMSDVPGGTGILLKAPGGAYVQIDEKGVHIGNGTASITLIDDQVNVNDRLTVKKKR